MKTYYINYLPSILYFFEDCKIPFTEHEANVSIELPDDAALEKLLTYYNGEWMTQQAKKELAACLLITDLLPDTTILIKNNTQQATKFN